MDDNPFEINRDDSNPEEESINKHEESELEVLKRMKEGVIKKRSDSSNFIHGGSNYSQLNKRHNSYNGSEFMF